MLKKTETTKLFYNKYTHRVKISLNLSFLLRPTSRKKNEKVLTKLEEAIKNDRRASKDRIYETGEWSWRPVHVTETDVKEARMVQSILADSEDVKIRIESRTILLYFNDRSAISKIEDKVGHLITELTEPNMKFIDSIKEGKEVVSSKFRNYQYKVFFNFIRDQSLPDWLAKNSDAYEISHFAEYELKRNHPTGRMQVYVKDTKALTMLQMRMPSNIVRMHELVHK